MGGNFLSQPKRDGPGECDTDRDVNMSYGVIGLQGWRLNMEDAHLCIPALKKHIQNNKDLKLPPDELEKVPECSLFGVFDGHGGHEVSQMCSSKFVQFLMNEDSFKSGDYEQALKNVYLKLDQFVISEEGQELLQKIIDDQDEIEEEEEDDEEEENEEAQLDDLEEDSEDGEEEEKEEEEHGEGEKHENGVADDDEDEDDEGVSSEGVGELLNSLMNNDFMSFLAKRTQQMKEELSALGDDEDDDDEFNPDEISESDEEEEEDDEDSDHGESGEKDDKECGEKTEGKKTDDKEVDTKKNGNTDEIKSNLKNNESTAMERGDTCNSNGISTKLSSEENKGSNCKETLTDKPEEQEKTEETTTEVSKSKSSRKNKAPKKLDTQGSGDNNEQPQVGDYAQLVNEDSSEDEPLLGGESLMQKPGYDSGCTAVVALKVDSKLYVANAGDSRCVLCYKAAAAGEGQQQQTVVALSRDHTPAVQEEVDRVYEAGGEIHAGRVDGGLNLTRAIGDHRYKQDSDLPPEKQRISCMPDVSVTDLSKSRSASADATVLNGACGQEELDFLIVGCDGVWECLTNEVAAQSVKESMKSQNLFLTAQKLAQKCISDSCDTTTGLDNVTAVIATLGAHHLTEKLIYTPERKAKTANSNSTYDKVPSDKIDSTNEEGSKESNKSENGVNGHHEAKENGETKSNGENENETENGCTSDKLSNGSDKTEDLKRRNIEGSPVTANGDVIERDSKVAKTDVDVAN